jgi:hypothetical protein
MNDLFRSEWRRFRGLALIVALLHAAALFLLSRAVEVQQLGNEDQGMMLVVYMILGLVLAMLQVGSYRRTSRWLWLIHRPVSIAKIFAAQALAAFALLGLAILLPLILFLLGTEFLTSRVVDVRHYVSSVLGLAFVMMAWFAGAFASTSRSKFAICVLLGPLVLLLHTASVWALTAPVVLGVIWMAFIARHGFRADRNAPITRTGVLWITAIPLQIAFFLFAFQASKAGYAVVKLLARSNPGRTVLESDTDFDVEAYLRSLRQSFVAAGLEESGDPRAPLWREQMPMLEITSLSPDVHRFPVRHQFGNDARPWWDDLRGIQWTFDHDRMLFRGRRGTTGEPIGWWGTGGAASNEVFSEAPLHPLTRSVLYEIDPDSQRQREWIRLPDGEWFVGKPVRGGHRLLVLTNRNLSAYRPEPGARFDSAPPKLDWQVPFARNEVPVQVDVAELLDGWLVSLFYCEDREFDGFDSLAAPSQQVLFVSSEGDPVVVGERRNLSGIGISLGDSLTIPAASWWISPPLQIVTRAAEVLFDTGKTRRPGLEFRPAVAGFYSLALALAALSVAGAYLRLRRCRLPRGRRPFWLMSCALFGLPALLSMVVLEPRVVDEP